MADPFTSKAENPENQTVPESAESFGDILSEYQKSHSRKTEGSRQIAGHGDRRQCRVGVFRHRVQVGRHSATSGPSGRKLKPGDKCLVTVKGRDPDGYYELSRFKVERPMDWTGLEKAFADKRPFWAR